jgi:hypothetical protein
LARDNFSKSIIDTLKARVAHRCSNPDCRVPTSAPSSKDKVNNIGIAAHICAASPGGPRYDSSMTPEKRKSLSNGIWLCSNCSIDIDRDERYYTVSILNKWKSDAEGTARIELGKKLPSNGETIDTVTAALTGFPKSYIANAISNVHQASKKSLESLDPRFLVKTAHSDGNTSIGIYAKENVSLSMTIDDENAKEYMEKHRQLIEHGKDVEIKSNAITIEGSKLFEEIFGSNDGNFRILARKLKATQKLWLVQKGTNLLESFDDIQGEISFGTKSFTFKGTSCDELFSFSYQKSLDESQDKANITMSLCLDRWEGVSLRFLPYLTKLSMLFEKMSQGWDIFTSLEINGMKVLSSVGMDVSSWDYVIDTHSFLNYINRCRIISEKFNFDISYTSNVSYTSEDHQYIADVADVIEGKQVYDVSNITSNASCELIVDNECKNVKALVEVIEPDSLRMVQQIGEDIELFGINVNLPAKIISLDSVLPKIYKDINDLKCGDVVKVEWLPQEDFKCIVSYES